MKLPKECPVCEYRKFRETEKKLICEACGWTIWKFNQKVILSSHQKPMERPKPLPIEKLKEEYEND